MRSLVVEEPRRVAWQEVPEPQRRYERVAIVRPLAVAACDLDLPMILGGTPFPLPIHLGHECVWVRSSRDRRALLPETE